MAKVLVLHLQAQFVPDRTKEVEIFSYCLVILWEQLCINFVWVQNCIVEKYFIADKIYYLRHLHVSVESQVFFIGDLDHIKLLLSHKRSYKSTMFTKHMDYFDRVRSWIICIVNIDWVDSFNQKSDHLFRNNSFLIVHSISLARLHTQVKLFLVRDVYEERFTLFDHVFLKHS